MSHIQQLLDKIREKLYRGDESDRLKSMHEKLEARDTETHADFLDKREPRWSAVSV